jgi:hypothetical protein
MNKEITEKEYYRLKRYYEKQLQAIKAEPKLSKIKLTKLLLQVQRTETKWQKQQKKKERLMKKSKK